MSSYFNFKIPHDFQVVNAFATQEDPEMRGKSIARLQSITDLCKVLEKCLSGLSIFNSMSKFDDVFLTVATVLASSSFFKMEPSFQHSSVILCQLVQLFSFVSNVKMIMML